MHNSRTNAAHESGSKSAVSSDTVQTIRLSGRVPWLRAMHNSRAKIQRRSRERLQERSVQGHCANHSLKPRPGLSQPINKPCHEHYKAEPRRWSRTSHVSRSSNSRPKRQPEITSVPTKTAHLYHERIITARWFAYLRIAEYQVPARCRSSAVEPCALPAKTRPTRRELQVLRALNRGRERRTMSMLKHAIGIKLVHSHRGSSRR